MSLKKPSSSFIRKYINSPEFHGLNLNEIMKKIGVLWDEKQARKMQKSVCSQLSQNQQTCLSDPSCAWVNTSSSRKKSFCRNSSDADIISLLQRQNKINQTSSPQEVRLAVLLYKKGITACV
jgi:hypothetical protein